MQLSCSKKNLFSKQCYFCVLVNSMGERGRKKYFVNYFLFKLVNFFTFVIYICLGWTRQWDIDWCFTWRRGHLQGSTSGEQCPLVRTDYLDITGRSTLLRRGGEDAWCSVNLTCCNLVFLKHKMKSIRNSIKMESIIHQSSSEYPRHPKTWFALHIQQALFQYMMPCPRPRLLELCITPYTKTKLIRNVPFI